MNAATAATAQQGTVPEWTLGDRMRKAMDVAGLDTQEIAQELGIARQSVSNYINGHTRPQSRYVLRQWAEITGVDFHWLVYGEPAGGFELPRKDSNLQPAGYRPEQNDQLKRLAGVPDEGPGVATSELRSRFLKRLGASRPTDVVDRVAVAS